MKVIVTHRFIDRHTKKPREVGEVFTCNKARFAEILEVGEFVKELKEPKKGEAE